jgi:hypothetical protein
MWLLEVYQAYSSRPDAGILVLMMVFESISLSAPHGLTLIDIHATYAPQLMSLLATGMWCY